MAQNSAVGLRRLLSGGGRPPDFRWVPRWQLQMCKRDRVGAFVGRRALTGSQVLDLRRIDLYGIPPRRLSLRSRPVHTVAARVTSESGVVPEELACQDGAILATRRVDVPHVPSAWRRRHVHRLDVLVVGADIADVRKGEGDELPGICLLYTSPSPRDRTRSRMPSSA